MSLSKRVVVALIAGLVVGIAVASAKNPTLNSAVAFLEPLGTLWVNAIRMTVIPLVISLLIVGIASAADTGVIGRLGLRSLAAFLALLIVSAVIAIIVAPPLFEMLSIDPANTASLRAAASSTGQTAAEGAKHLPSFAQWLTDLVPVNPIKAAADGTMLPLVIFAVLFAAALIRVPEEGRRTLISFFTAVGSTMLTLARWIIGLAPIGVFILMLGLASRLGVSAAGAVGFYTLTTCGIYLIGLILLYPVAMIGGGVPLRQFARAASSVQAVAFSTRSSLATLPALIDSADRVLRLPAPVAGFVLPLAVSTFKMSTPALFVVCVIFIARLYGIALTSQQILTVAALAIFLSFATPGIPSGGLLIMAPLFTSIGLPIEGIGILIALDVLPDAVRGVVNTTADLAVATVVARHSGDGTTSGRSAA